MQKVRLFLKSQIINLEPNIYESQELFLLSYA